MRVLVVGGTGLIGEAVADALEGRGHAAIRVGFRRGDATVDLADPSSILEMYRTVGEVDAVVSTAGVAVFGAVEELDDAAWAASLANKLMGQVRLVRFGIDHLNEGASFTLTTGTLSQRPTPGTAAVATVGGAVESFVRAAALDVEGRYRINVVSPGWVAESRQAMGLDPLPGIWARDLAEYYLHCLDTDITGHVFEAEGPIGEG